MDVWTVARVSALLYSSLLIVWLVAGTVLWFIARAAGIVDGIEKAVETTAGLDSFDFLGSQAFIGVLLSGLVMVVVSTGMTTLGAIFYNQISEVVGGVKISVEETDPRP